eukprot:TRINITY_DN4271_c0_g1_i2.p1 TRINITY_DN4271_c0_g1~~TRINITY_DN4271_c0_g1_i2.p1  ORF type:complete len:261 (+),score=65.12 TRINITY_DN4271_c0_g1_i2:55-837(+)
MALARLAGFAGLSKKFFSSATAVESWKKGIAVSELTKLAAIPVVSTRADKFQRLLVDFALAKEAPPTILEHLLHNAPVPRTATHYNVLLHTHLIRDRNVDKSKSVLGQMQSEGIHKDVSTFEILIGYHSKSGDLAVAESLVEEMKSSQISMTPTVCQLMIIGYAQKSDVAKAEQWQQKLKTELNMAPSLEASRALLTMYRQLGEQNKGKYDAKEEEVNQQVKKYLNIQRISKPKERIGKLPVFKPVVATKDKDDKKGGKK